MNWEALGASAELIAALAVIGSLLYVGWQIRQNTRATRATSAREAAYRYSDWNKEVVSNPRFSELYALSFKDPTPAFTNEEWNEMSAFIKALFHIYEAQFINAKFDVGIGDQVEPQLRTARWAIDTFPVYKRFWLELRNTGFWTEGFEHAVESVSPAKSGGVHTRPGSQSD